MTSRKRKAWQYEEEKYEASKDFYERVTGWYNGAVDLAPQVFRTQSFPPYDQFYSLGGVDEKFTDTQRDVEKQEREDSKYLRDGQLPSINLGRQPIIGVIYGPTGSGKSHLIRALISCNMLDPIPETVIFVTPERNMIPPIEQTSWNLQLIESNYDCKEDGTFAPRTSTFRPEFIELTYDEATAPEHLNIDHPDNIYVKASRQGPLAIIMDECMDKLCTGSSVSVLFHALPSKLFARSAHCTAFYIFVVLHNMAPRTAIGNVPTLKVNAKMHIMSCHIPQFQFAKFLYAFAHNISKDLMIVLKAYFAYLQQHQKFSWIMYTPDPVSDSFRWCTVDQEYAIIPLNVNIQEKFLKTSKNIIKFVEAHRKQLEHRPSLTHVETLSP
ncbi:IVa2 [turkey adenovirus 5]|uniref:IVa2 n=1 Tax=turkey adenovirus 5 TaxID=1408258 RepID=U5NE72_9ADEN|nr:IVa2 [Turkey aviadenovirus 5]AGX93332.1 IVa2 [Turkey aviadenovirus 5]AGX93369.1 IVa2 [Turkey aviadenovirus 5]